MKVELISNVSHDLKTPLTSILSYAQLLRQEPLEGAAADYARIIDEKAQRLKSMVQDVFEVPRRRRPAAGARSGWILPSWCVRPWRIWRTPLKKAALPSGWTCRIRRYPLRRTASGCIGCFRTSFKMPCNMPCRGAGCM